MTQKGRSGAILAAACRSSALKGKSQRGAAGHSIPEVFGKPEQRFHYVLPGPMGDTLGGEQPLEIPRPAPVESNAPPAAGHQRNPAGPQRILHLQQQVKPARLQFLLQFVHSPAAGPLVQHQKVHSGKPLQQGMLDLPDNPGNAGLRPGASDGLHDGQRVTAIPDGGQADHAQAARRGSTCLKKYVQPGRIASYTMRRSLDW